MGRRFLCPAMLVTLFLLPLAALAGDWPQFRGPTGCGLSSETNLPTSWDASTGLNILWKAPLPFNSSPSPSSPIVAGDFVYVTLAQDKPLTPHHVACFSRADGKQLWITAIEPGPWKPIDKRAGNAAPTPCTDGKSVYAIFGSGVLVALDARTGKILWRNELETNQFDCAMGGSPILYQDTVIYLADRKKGVLSSILAWDKNTGKLAWETQRPDCIYSHSTPVLATVDGQPQLVVAASPGLQGLDPTSGKLLWQASAGQGESATPALAGDLAYYDSGRGGGGAVVKLGGTGTRGKESILAKVAFKSEVGSPVIANGLIFRNGKDLLQVARLDTGKILYAQPLKGLSSWASPIAAGDRVYYATSGKSFCIQAGEPFKLLGESDLGDENTASPAVADGNLYLKGVNFLWCIGNKPSPQTQP